jgi:hypothetical protein
MFLSMARPTIDLRQSDCRDRRSGPLLACAYPEAEGAAAVPLD